ncbi:MAG: sodium/proline symporter [Xanthomonadales bacterium]|nr:sodium/proline symporter [Xanthomonadales bacterium]
MTHGATVLLTLVLYQALLLGIGWWARNRNHDQSDFFLGGRALGPLVAAISYSSSASSAWTLLGVSGIAYVLGVSALWIAAGSFTGMLVAWFWIGPRLRRHSRERGHITLTDLLAEGCDGAARRTIVISASVIIVFSFTFYVAAQFQGAGNTFASTFDLPMRDSILVGALIIMIYTMLGGFWAVSVTDTVQGLLMALAAVLLPIAALLELGGVGGFLAGLERVSSPAQLAWTGEHLGLVAIGFVFGSLGISLGTFGQPHLLVRFMALRDERAMRQARLITIAWYSLVFLAMLFVGLAGHVLHAGLDNPENIFFVMTGSLFPALLGAVLLAAVLSAIMSTADSQLLVAASAISHDLGAGTRRPLKQLLISRLTIVGLVLLAVLVALYLPERIFSRVLFAWSALGAAFGPIVFFRLAGRPVRPGGVAAAIIAGFGLSVVFYLAPNTPGDVLERLAPFAVALAILFAARPRDPSVSR